MAKTITAASPFSAEITKISDMLAGAQVLAPRSALVLALRHARSALIAADLATAGWEPIDDRDDFVDLILGDLEQHGALMLSAEAWDTATVQRSRIDHEVYRLTTAGREWIVRITTEGGYGDDGSGTRECVEELLYGEVDRG